MPYRSQKRLTSPRSAFSGQFAIAQRVSAGTVFESMPEANATSKWPRCNETDCPRCPETSHAPRNYTLIYEEPTNGNLPKAPQQSPK